MSFRQKLSYCCKPLDLSFLKQSMLLTENDVVALCYEMACFEKQFYIIHHLRFDTLVEKADGFSFPVNTQRTKNQIYLFSIFT